jgi:hypothetical protein
MEDIKRAFCCLNYFSVGRRLSARGIHSVYVPFYRVPRDQAIDLDGSEPNTTPRSGELERAVYTPAVDIGGQGGARLRQPRRLGCI